MTDLTGQVVFITGASSGIGAAAARAFARLKTRLLICARREERLRALAPELERLGAAGVLVRPVDTRDSEAVARLVDSLPAPWKEIEVLLNNAGLSRGLDKLHEGSLADWREMIETNVLGLLHVDRAVVPLMAARGRGIVVHLGSVAGEQVYPGGNVYCASKHAVDAITRGLRMDLLGTGVRVTSVDPGLVQTEFSEVRFHGDTKRAAAVYEGITPLAPEDVADAIVFAATRPAHVSVAEMTLYPADQASARDVNRRRS
jgi:serine 3-dehydrogenase